MSHSMINTREDNAVVQNGQTFIVEIECRQNRTWQGTVKWVEHGKSTPFRSVLELLKLIDSASDEKDSEEKMVKW